MEEENEMIEQEAPEESGRGTDSVMAHMSLGEVVIPRAVQDDPEVQAMLAAIFEKAGADINEFTVGHEANKINPETGYPEFFFKKLKKIFRAVAPIAVSFIPGIGPLAGAALGGGIGALSGGGLKGALSGALGGYAGAGGASAFGKALGMTSKLGQTALGSGLLGAASGGIQGGAKGALLGGALGGVGGYANAGGFDDIYQGSMLQDAVTGASGALNRVGTGVSDLYNGSALQDVFRSGGEALKSAGINLDGGSNVGSTPIAAGGGSSSYSTNLPSNTKLGNVASDFGNQSRDLLNSAGTGNAGINGFNTASALPSAINTGVSEVAQSTGNNKISSLLSAALGTYSNDAAEDAQLQQQRNNQALLAPYQNFDFNPQDLQNDPGYQFNLAQGNQAQDRAQLSRGGYFSGNALKEAQTFGQGLADNTYNSAFNRALQTNQQGFTGALAGGAVNENIGNIRSNSLTNKNNLYTGALGSILGGDTYDNTGALQGGRGQDALTQYFRQLEMQRMGAY
jgi:hypothetical protein